MRDSSFLSSSADGRAAGAGAEDLWNLDLEGGADVDARSAVDKDDLEFADVDTDLDVGLEGAGDGKL